MSDFTVLDMFATEPCDEFLLDTITIRPNLQVPVFHVEIESKGLTFTVTTTVQNRLKAFRCLTSINTFSAQLQDPSYCLCAVKAHVSAGILGHFLAELTLEDSQRIDDG